MQVHTVQPRASGPIEQLHKLALPRTHHLQVMHCGRGEDGAFAVKKPGLYKQPVRHSADARTLPSLMRLAITSSAIDFGTASYCLKIIVNVPRPCVTVRIAFE